MSNASRHVTIIGAGIAGLAAARTLADAGATVELIESSDRIGGRVASDTVGGFTLDRGFQIYLSAYPEGKRFLDLKSLDLKPFMPGALVWNGARSATIAHPMREPLAAIAGVVRGVVPPSDALRMIPFASAALRGSADAPGASRGSSLERLRGAGISDRTIDGFFRSFFGGVFFDRTLATDASRLDFLLRMFAEGFACVPARGMGEIPAAMLRAMPAGRVRVRLNTAADAIDGTRVTLASGERLDADAVIVATDAHALRRFVRDLPEIPWCSTLSAWFATPDASLLSPWLVLNGTGRGGDAIGSFNHGAAMSSIAPSYCAGAAGRGLFVANTTSLPANPDTAADTAEDMHRTLREILGAAATDGWELLATQRIPHAIPRQWTADIAARLPAQLGARAFVAGDHLEDSSINGAMRSGRKAAESCLAAIG